MKPSLCLPLAALCTATFVAPQSGDVEQKVGALEKRVAELTAEIAELKKAPSGAEATEKALEELRGALRAQGDAAARLASALDDSQAKGFTYGINPDSRVALLQGFREYCDAVKSAAPPAPAKRPATGVRAPAAQR
jgi:hypothetical protein